MGEKDLLAAAEVMESSLSRTENHPPERRRADARQQIADKWASRRKQTEMDNQVKAASSKATLFDSSTSTNTNTNTNPQPSFCYFLKQLWDDALPPRQPLKKSGKRSSTTSSFPSVLSILQANELKQQVEFMKEKDEAASILSVLPADYSFTQAIFDMSQTRSRAFLLLDLAAIVKTHVCWRKQLGKHVQFVYQVQHNSNPKLLQVLQRLQVGLRVATKYDLDMLCADDVHDNARSTHNNNNKNSSSSPPPKIILMDHTSSGAKTNSFYRKLVLDQKVTTLAVDGPDEVIRLHQALSSMAQRRKQELPSLSLIFRVPQDTSNAKIKPGSRALLQDTQGVATQYFHQVVGISLELPSDDNEACYPEFCQMTSSLLACLQEDLEGTALPQLDLTGLRLTDTIPAYWMDWFVQLKPHTQRITLDVSYLLVANAGALCTRIIGVKQNESDSMHYYIDDGCYGSLYNSTGEARIPLPLRTRGDEYNKDKDIMDESSSCQLMKATVWGPTCDGLDKVCQDIELPIMARDDWLVFPNLGFCNVGTAFNGLPPPDTAYCVLGGYLHRGLEEPNNE
jgi:ornithine decarboxylase